MIITHYDERNHMLKEIRVSVCVCKYLLYHNPADHNQNEFSFTLKTKKISFCTALSHLKTKTTAVVCLKFWYVLMNEQFIISTINKAAIEKRINV